MNAIYLKNIKKGFHDQTILKGIDLEISGSFGLLGPNGAGKTTLIRILCNVLQPTEGEIYSDNHLNWKDINKVKGQIGYLPQSFSFYKNVTVFNSLEYIAVLKGISRKEVKTEIERVLEETNLLSQIHKKIKHLSGGMIRRLGIAQALIGNPKFIMVDEPTAGLDIEERIRFRQLLRKLGNNRTVLISSHIVDDIETTCDNICILREGEVLISGQLSPLLQSIKGQIREITVSKMDIDSFSNEIISIKEEDNQYKVRYFSSEFSNHNEGIVVNPSLEDLYMYLMNKDVQKRKAFENYNLDLK